MTKTFCDKCSKEVVEGKPQTIPEAISEDDDFCLYAEGYTIKIAFVFNNHPDHVHRGDVHVFCPGCLFALITKGFQNREKEIKDDIAGQE